MWTTRSGRIGIYRSTSMDWLPYFSSHGGHKVTQKRSPSFTFFVFNTGYLKFCVIIELVIPKKSHVFCFSNFKYFGGKRWMKVSVFGSIYAHRVRRHLALGNGIQNGMDHSDRLASSFHFPVVYHDCSGWQTVKMESTLRLVHYFYSELSLISRARKKSAREWESCTRR